MGYLRNLAVDPCGIRRPHEDRSFIVARQQAGAPVHRVFGHAAAALLVAPLATPDRSTALWRRSENIK